MSLQLTIETLTSRERSTAAAATAAVEESQGRVVRAVEESARGVAALDTELASLNAEVQLCIHIAYVTMTYTVMGYVVIAYAVMAYTVIAFVVIAYTVMAYVFMACVIIACTVMAYIVMAHALMP